MKDMYKKYTEAEVYVAIKRGFDALYQLSRAELKKDWKKFDVAQKYSVGRGLVQLRDVAKQPGQSFSRVATGEQWRQRAREWATAKGVDVSFAYYIVEDPAMIVQNKVEPAFGAMRNNDLFREYIKFCELVQKWEYRRTSEKNACAADMIAQELVAKAERFVKLMEVKNSNCLVRPIKELLCSYSR